MVGGFTATIARKVDRMKFLAFAIQMTLKKGVLVGITQETSTRPGEPINNAELLYVHTHGSPARGIPARPVIEPAIEADGNRERITDAMAESYHARLMGKEEVAKQWLYDAGQYGEDAARNWFTDPRNGWPPNQPETIERKLEKMEGKQGKLAKEAYEAGQKTYEFRGQTFGVDTPLIDSGEMRKSITHCIRDK